MSKLKKFAKIGLCISIVLMLLCSIVVSVVQTDGGNVTMKELMVETDAGYAISAYLFIPDTATAENPAPAVVTCHGWLNNKEMQDANYVELARRGYVVLAIDQPGHGDSDNTDSLVSEFMAMPIYYSALTLSRLPYVDSTKIGVTGHSMGGLACNYGVQSDNALGTNIISAVLLNCADATYIDSDGAFTNIYGSRDVGMISAQYDEFFFMQTDASGNTLESPYFMESPQAQSFLYFGEDPTGQDARSEYTVYHETTNDEDAIRVIYRPAIIHPWSHFSKRATANVIDFFEAAFGAPNPISSSNQVWQVKEAFNFVGVIGFVLFIVCFAVLLVFTPLFSSLRAPEVVQPVKVEDKKGAIWFWCSLAAGALFSTLIYRGVLAFGTSLTSSQFQTMGLGLWSFCCGLFTILSMVVFYFCYGKKHGMDLAARGVKMPLKQLGKTVLLAVIVAAMAYTCVFIADYFFMADFRLWTLAIKAFKPEKFLNALWPALWLFGTYYVASSVATNCFNYNSIGGHSWVNTLIVSIFAALPAIILPAMQYGTYVSTNAMLFDNVMHILWLFPIILILFTATVVSRIIYKVTNNPYLAGIINAIIITLMTVTNTETLVF